MLSQCKICLTLLQSQIGPGCLCLMNRYNSNMQINLIDLLKSKTKSAGNVSQLFKMTDNP